MLLPNASNAVIDAVKLRDYVLSSSHPIGRFKVRFFAALGFTADAWPEFERALREQHLTQDASPMGIDVHGQAFAIRAILQGPTGASALVVSVWFVRAGEAVPRFVTAYPGVLSDTEPIGCRCIDARRAGSRTPSGDLGAVVERTGTGQFLVEFVAASGRTQALVIRRGGRSRGC